MAVGVPALVDGHDAGDPSRRAGGIGRAVELDGELGLFLSREGGEWSRGDQDRRQCETGDEAGGSAMPRKPGTPGWTGALPERKAGGPET